MNSFLLGVGVTTCVSCMIWALSDHILPRHRKKIDQAKRTFRFDSLTHAFDVVEELGYGCGGAERAMVAIATGKHLIFQHLDKRLLRFLGYTDSDVGPRSVYDLLPQNLAARHDQWVADVISKGTLPTRLKHPLRSVQMKSARGCCIRMDLNIERIDDSSEPSFQLIFAPCQHASPLESRTLRVGEQQEHHDAYVMLLDIVEFTKACAQLSAVQVLEWMKLVRLSIEETLAEHKMRLIETRGDNYLAITTADDGPAPATRAVSFAARASAAVAALHDTRIRVGLARGHVTVAQLQCMGGRDVLCLFGDVVNVAGRLEQSADPQCVHLSEPVAQAYAAENQLPPPPIRVIQAKGKPAGIRCARLDWRAGEFVDRDPPAAAAAAAAAAADSAAAAGGVALRLETAAAAAAVGAAEGVLVSVSRGAVFTRLSIEDFEEGCPFYA